jgi:UDP-2,3-diacylglucosamine pyrophosphatase LpxH
MRNQLTAIKHTQNFISGPKTKEVKKKIAIQVHGKCATGAFPERISQRMRQESSLTQQKIKKISKIRSESNQVKSVKSEKNKIQAIVNLTNNDSRLLDLT